MFAAALPPIGVGPSNTDMAVAGSSPLIGWIVVSFTVWLFLQFRPSRRRVWAARGELIAPLIVTLLGDATAILRSLFVWREVRRMRKSLG